MVARIRMRFNPSTSNALRGGQVDSDSLLSTPSGTPCGMEGALLGYEYLRAHAEVRPRYQLCYCVNIFASLSEFDNDAETFAARLTRDSRDVART
eukprot:7841798-Pyramimonas_sp.AAC.1